jgi:uncharacterized protein YaaW (UPF0174 family)
MLSKLTKEQKNLMVEVMDEWIKFCLGGDTTINRKDAIDGIRWIYGLAKKKSPFVIFVSGPMECQWACWFLKAYFKDNERISAWFSKINDKIRSNFGSDVLCQVRSQVNDNVREQIHDQVYAKIKDQVSTQVYENISYHIQSHVSSPVSDLVNEQIRDNVRAQVIDQVRVQVSEQVSAQVLDQVSTQVSAQVLDQVRTQIRSQVIDQVLDQVLDQVRTQVVVQVSEQVSAQVLDQVRTQVVAQVLDQVRTQVVAQVNEQVIAQVLDQGRTQVIAQVIDQVIAQVLDQGRTQVSAQVNEQVINQVLDQVRTQILDQVNEQVSSHVRNQVRDKIYEQVHEQISFQVRDKIYEQILDQVRDHAGEQVTDNEMTRLIMVSNHVYDQIRSQVLEQVNAKEKEFFYYSYEDGGYSASWVSYYDFFNRIGIVKSDNFDKYKNYIRSGIFMSIFLEDFAIVCPRPKYVKKDERGRLHSADSAAIGWGNGEKYYYWHGIRIAEKIILNPKELTKDEILNEKNSEISRAMSEILGWDEYMRRVDTILIDKWFDTERCLHYELYDFKNRFELTPRLLKMESPELKDGTRPYYIEPVHYELNSCQAARKWQFCKQDGTWPSVEECNKYPEMHFEIEA